MYFSPATISTLKLTIALSATFRVKKRVSTESRSASADRCVGPTVFFDFSTYKTRNAFFVNPDPCFRS